MRRKRNTRRDAISDIEKARRKNLANRRRAICRGESQKQFIPSWDCEPTEFEVQVYLYNELRQRDYLVRGELRSKCGKCQFDLIVYKDAEPIRIIEVKNAKALLGKYNPVNSPAKTHAEQVDKYAEFGVPVDLIRGMIEAIHYIREHDLRNGFRQPLSSTPEQS